MCKKIVLTTTIIKLRNKVKCAKIREGCYVIFTVMEKQLFTIVLEQHMTRNM